jgi:hypothetical protein
MTIFLTIFKANKNVLNKLLLPLHYATMLHLFIKIKRINKKNKENKKKREAFFQGKERRNNQKINKINKNKNKKKSKNKNKNKAK